MERISEVMSTKQELIDRLHGAEERIVVLDALIDRLGAIVSRLTMLVQAGGELLNPICAVAAHTQCTGSACTCACHAGEGAHDN